MAGEQESLLSKGRYLLLKGSFCFANVNGYCMRAGEMESPPIGYRLTVSREGFSIY
ncbi:hypothetical protein CHY_1842 [Carboxydothermus hydrogenoformans Z-2901]|uniref:Uncharacterized protein n=1 Tax=Carboxydothermus hydrogenoformans (strain ATCC BAA-161 / DSM 6008 / Z-2901) TaxID=246194 RepID=Q3AB22_CARHZ|nr:hypothetical protein CHY_1842 [Carboxydothermus hydrogenoformans Z-2901]